MKSDIKSRRLLKLLVLLAAFMVICAAAVAENGIEDTQENNIEDMEKSSIEDAEGSGIEDAEKKEILTTLEQRMLKRISVEFRDTSIDDVIRIMAEQADVDVVKSPKVTGNVTATLTDVPLEEALNNILTAHGYRYVTGKNMLRIAPAEEITEEAERLVSRIYRINYADTIGVERALLKFISKQGSLSSSPGTSNIIVTDTESKIKAIDTFMDEVDRITPQILVEARIYDITSRQTLDLGVEWEAGRRTDAAFTGTVGTNPTSGPRNPFLTSGFTGATSETEDISGALRLGFLDSSIDIDMILRAQQQDVDAKLLANPRILVLDNEEAVFDIVTEHPYVEKTISGGTITETVKFKEVGVKLSVRPHVTRDGMLRLNITPEFGVVIRQVLISASNVPVVDTRKLDTIALVEDGQTVVLGGLRKKDVSKTTNKIPLLGDIPLIGALFRFEGEDTSNTELVVFITPRIIKLPFLSQAEERAYQATEFSGPQTSLTRAEKSEK